MLGPLLGGGAAWAPAPTPGPVSLLDVRPAGREYTLPHSRKAFKPDVLDFLENQVT